MNLQSASSSAARRQSGISLLETVIALTIATLVLSGLITGFVQSARQAEVSAYTLAAQAQASQGLEQVRAAKWDLSGTLPVDQLTNFANVVQALDIPSSSSRPIYGTNITTISLISSNPWLKMVQVDCVWTFLDGRLFTNSIYSYRSPDQ
jgi:Tfp pilus assembly protein PilV